MTAIRRMLILAPVAALAAWVGQPQEPQPDYYCKANGTSCKDEPILINNCGIPDCDQYCMKCVVMPSDDREGYECERFEEVECTKINAKVCKGLFMVDPCSFFGTCGNLWQPTGEDCSFELPDCF
jgi:hypothetical protein